MAVLDKVKIETPNLRKSKLDISGIHITTGDFMNLQPCFYRHCIAGEHVSVNANAVMRLAPLAVPTYGRARLNLRAFFVPFRTIFPNWNNFITDTIGSDYSTSSLVDDSPIIGNKDFVSYFRLSANSTPITNWTNEPYDFYSGGNHYVLTSQGRYHMKILNSLGYRWDWDDKNTTNFSALALLSFIKVYLDWYSASSYQDTTNFLILQRLCEYNSPSNKLVISLAQLTTALAFISQVCYDGDYFTTAWDNPVSPNNGLSSDYSITDPTVTSNPQIVSQSANNHGTPTVAATNIISQYGIDALKQLTNYVKRHQMVGARAIDRYLADHGINLAAEKMKRSIYLGAKSIDCQIGDVMSTSSGNGAISELGDYAGKGMGAGSALFEYDTDEYGLFLICYSILPNGGYVQGFDRNNLHIKRTDFFLNDFDCLGVQAIAKGELYMSKNQGFYSTGSDFLGNFGYTSRYAEYKRPMSWLTGDVSLGQFVGQDSWHLFRMFQDSSFNSLPANVVHSLSFVQGNDFNQYGRIFQNTANNADKFTIVFNFNASTFAPCRSLFDTYDFDDGGKQITMDANGTKMN